MTFDVHPRPEDYVDSLPAGLLANSHAFSSSVIPTASPAPVDHRNLVPTYEHPARKRAPVFAEGGVGHATHQKGPFTGPFW